MIIGAPLKPMEVHHRYRKCALSVLHWAPRANGDGDTLAGSCGEAFSEPTRQLSASPRRAVFCFFAARTLVATTSLMAEKAIGS